MEAPWAAVPLPGGNPVPSARIAISQRAASPGCAGCPRLGLEFVPAAIAAELASSRQRTMPLSVGMRHLSMAVHGPTGDRVAMVILEGRNKRLRVELAAGGDEFRACGLE